MIKRYYYAKLNENNICVEIISRTEKVVSKDLIPIPDYNESLFYRRWDGEQWSQEKYEPDTNEVIEKSLSELKEEVTKLETDLQDRLLEIEELQKELASSKMINSVNLKALIELNDRIVELEGGNK